VAYFRFPTGSNARYAVLQTNIEIEWTFVVRKYRDTLISTKLNQSSNTLKENIKKNVKQESALLCSKRGRSWGKYRMAERPEACRALAS